MFVRRINRLNFCIDFVVFFVVPCDMPFLPDWSTLNVVAASFENIFLLLHEHSDGFCYKYSEAKMETLPRLMFSPIDIAAKQLLLLDQIDLEMSHYDVIITYSHVFTFDSTIKPTSSWSD